MKWLLLLIVIALFSCPSAEDLENEAERICEVAEGTQLPEELETICKVSSNAEYQEAEPTEIEKPPECDATTLPLLFAFEVPELPTEEEVTIDREEKQLIISDEIHDQLNDPTYINHISIESASDENVDLDEFLNWISLSLEDGTYFASSDTITDPTELDTDGSVNVYPHFDNTNQKISFFFSVGLYSPAEEVLVEARFDLKSLDCTP